MYDVVGRYIAGTLLVAALAGVVTLAASLSLGVPLAPLLAVWVAICNPIPQIGGFLGAVPFVAARPHPERGRRGHLPGRSSSSTSRLENHVLQPLIIGRAVRLTPPATMVAALVGVAAGGVVGGLLAIPLLGATQGDLPRDSAPPSSRSPAPSWARPTEHLPR